MSNAFQAQIDNTNRVEDDVSSDAIGVIKDLLPPFIFAIVEADTRAVARSIGAFLIRSGRSDDTTAQGRRDLDGHDSEPARGRVNQDGFPRLQACPFQRAVAYGERGAEARRVGEAP